MNLTADQKKLLQNVGLPALCVGLVLLVLFWPSESKAPISDPTTVPTETITAPTSTDLDASVDVPEETVPTTTVPAKPKATGKLPYEEAVELYGGYRIQFVDCHGTPGTMTIKKGSSIMLDNRDAKTRAIKVGTKSYSIAAYDYAIATVNEVGTLDITCAGGGAAQLTVQP